MPLLDKEHLAQWLYETTPRQGDVGRFTWEYLPDEGITGKHAYQAWADVHLASEEWLAREAVVEAVAECLDDLGLLGLHTDEPDCAACRTRVRLLDGCARLTAVRRRT